MIVLKRKIKFNLSLDDDENFRISKKIVKTLTKIKKLK
jgi:hypothetical protein